MFLIKMFLINKNNVYTVFATEILLIDYINCTYGNLLLYNNSNEINLFRIMLILETGVFKDHVSCSNCSRNSLSISPFYSSTKGEDSNPHFTNEDPNNNSELSLFFLILSIHSTWNLVIRMKRRLTSCVIQEKKFLLTLLNLLI